MIRTRRTWTGLTLVALMIPAAGLRAADEKEEVEGDLKQDQGKWAYTSGNGDEITYTFDARSSRSSPRRGLTRSS